MKKIYLLMLAAVGLMFMSCEKGKGQEPEGKSKYTVIVYANGGGDLDIDIEDDISRAAHAFSKRGEDLSVRMIVCMKYSDEEGLQAQKEKNLEEYDYDYEPGGKASMVYFYEVGPDGIDYEEEEGVNQYLSLPDEWIAQDGRYPMFSPKSIAEVLQNAAKAAPAQHYILLLAGHSMGWEPESDGEYPSGNQKPAAAIADPHYDGRSIKAKELHDGIQQSGLHLSAIIFDCCFMNNLEYLSELTDVTDYTLGSGHTTKGSDFGTVVNALYDNSNIEDALKAQARNNRDQHVEAFKKGNDPRGRHTDFAVLKMSGMPAIWSGLQAVVNYMCEHVKDSAKYVSASTQCYQYYNNDCKYDLLDYLTLLKSEGAPYQGDEGFQTAYKSLETAIQSATIAHEEGHEYIEGYKPAHALSISVQLGAKGILQDHFVKDDEKNGYTCYDDEGNRWYYSPATKAGEKEVWTKDTEKLIEHNWDYSYAKSVFDQKTGWTKWLKANPAMPYNNPPRGDDDDYNISPNEGEEE